MTAAPKPLSQVPLALNLLSGLATDVPLHVLPTTPKDTFFPPVLTRTLFSLLLRTSSPFESRAAQTALLHAQSLPQPSTAACLGFPANASSELIRDVLQDLLLSASRGEPLLLTGSALKLYVDAGPDTDEYNNPTPDPRVSHATNQHPLAIVRAENLARAIVVFGHAFQEPSSKSVMVNIASRNMRLFLAPLEEHLPDNVALLANPLREAVKFFYAKFAAVATDQVRQQFVTRLTGSLMRLAKLDPSGISPYMLGITDPRIRLHACRVCLTQRFGVKDNSDNSPLNVETVSPYLKVSWQDSRYNRAVPALLNSLLTAWYETGDDSSFRFEANPVEHATRIGRKLCNLRDRLSRFGAPPRDLNALNATVILIGSKIAECNS